MNLHTVTKPNSKGQVVIPKKFREELGINEDVLLSLTLRGNGVYITPLDKSLGTSDSKQIALEILRRTQGAWKDDDDWDKTEARRRKIELKAAEERRKLW